MDTLEQATFMHHAWRLVLGRLAEAAPHLVDDAAAAEPRSRRPKHRGTPPTG